ncbi:amino acid aminotransferase [Neogemmobacter tilapiae]|uniref:Aromatic amino acid aminotransferase n=1 Tax=Neogemmobacter tilapiae TaxID=875041 RepID=A0A918TLR8_9RHOB|nr:amino acid aminotransferase [Gemmobacter tilapiae]GHC53205.1 aromatic amino acid aminotransferase [Gemmobacter tilapiae]
MFDALKAQPQDKILILMQQFRDDPRKDKIDLGVGVYKDAQGLTPVMRAVKTAEQQLWQAETTKTYTGLAGDPGFVQAMAELILGPGAQAAGAATPGGTGALRQAFELIRHAAPGAKVWLPAPTWPNHTAILRYLGMDMAEYRYFDEDSGGLDMGGLLEDLGRVAAGDVVLLHGCCHNPTGANPNPVEWQAIADVLAQRRAVALVDLAYQGFGDGLAEDAAATRLLADKLPELLIAASCSKNFGIYRERTGVLLALGGDRARVQENLAWLNRMNYSFPPDHGARLVTMILKDATLRADWQAELEQVRHGMLALRQALAQALQTETRSDRFGFVAAHRGMFSRLGLTPDQVERLRKDHGIYMVGDSRLNIAGLNAQTVTVLAKVVAGVL